MLLQTVGRFLTAVGLVTVASAAVLLHAGPQDSEAIELLRYTPYPLLLVPLLLAWLMAWTVGWAWRVAATAALLLLLGPVMGLSIGRAEGGTQLLRVMTYNVKSERATERPGGYDAILTELREQAPDLLVLQEAEGLADANRVPEALRQWLGEHRVWQRGQYLVASRHPLRGCRTLPLTQLRPDAEYLRCTLVVGERPVEVVTVHLHSPRQGLNATRQAQLGGLPEWRANATVRLAEARQLAEDLRQTPARPGRDGSAPLIVAGDLNAVESSPVLQSLLATGLRDAWSSSSVGWGYTHGHSLYPHVDLLRIDHILVSPDIAVRRAWVGGRQGSEHRPLIAELWLSRSPG